MKKHKNKNLYYSKLAAFFRKGMLIACILLLSGQFWLNAQRKPNLKVWDSVVAQAEDETVYFSAWGGSESINAYIRWAAKELKKRYNITLKHVKVTDTATVVAQILSEKQAGKTKGGNSDLLWINGENFKAMKKNDLLYGPFTNALPNARFLAKKNIFVKDFQEDINGLEYPWGTAQFVFFADTSKIRKTLNVLDLLALSEEMPGIFTYPKPPDFHGTTFLKQVLLELNDNKDIFLRAPANKAAFDRVTLSLWAYLDKLHPLLWRKGEAFPQNLAFQHQLLDEGEIALSFSFNPNEAQQRVLLGEFPKSLIAYTHQGGSLANAHYLAIPFNSDAKAAALVAINFFGSPEAQGMKNNVEVWGDPSVLNIDALSNEDKRYFQNSDSDSNGNAVPSQADLKRSLTEPHSDWVPLLEKEWARRYGS